MRCSPARAGQSISKSDKFPVEGSRFSSEQLKSDYYEFTDRGHFTGNRDECVIPELVEAVLKKLKGVNTPLS